DNAWAASPVWVQIPVAALGSDGYCGPGKCSYSHVISVAPSDPNILFAGGAENGLWRCSYCGGAPGWTKSTGPHADYHALAWVNQRLIVGNDGGVWSSTDLGNSWQNHNATFPTLMYFGASLHPTQPEIMLAGLRDNAAAVRTASGGWR